MDNRVGAISTFFPRKRRLFPGKILGASHFIKSKEEEEEEEGEKRKEKRLDYYGRIVHSTSSNVLFPAQPCQTNARLQSLQVTFQNNLLRPLHTQQIRFQFRSF